MIRHCVALTFGPDTTEADIDAIDAGLATLPGAIPEIVSYTFGRDLGIGAGNASYVVVADFESVEGYAIYRDHPVHQQVIADAIKPHLIGRTAVQTSL